MNTLTKDRPKTDRKSFYKGFSVCFLCIFFLINILIGYWNYYTERTNSTFAVVRLQTTDDLFIGILPTEQGDKYIYKGVFE